MLEELLELYGVVLEVLLVVADGEVVEVVLLLVVDEDEGSVLLLVVGLVVLDDVVLLVVFEAGTELTKVGSLVVTLPVGVIDLPL